MHDRASEEGFSAANWRESSRFERGVRPAAVDLFMVINRLAQSGVTLNHRVTLAHDCDITFATRIGICTREAKSRFWD